MRTISLQKKAFVLALLFPSVYDRNPETVLLGTPATRRNGSEENGDFYLPIGYKTYINIISMICVLMKQ